MNGDGAIDISDTVYLLTSLYLGGPDPKAIECPSPAGMGLPAMGQTKCYDTNGSEITCGNANYPGQDGGSGPCRAERTIDHLILDQTERLRKVLVTYAPDGSLCEIPGCPGSCSWRRRGDHFSLC